MYTRLARDWGNSSNGTRKRHSAASEAMTKSDSKYARAPIPPPISSHVSREPPEAVGHGATTATQAGMNQK